MFLQKPKIYKNYIDDWDSNTQFIVCANGIFKRVKVNSMCYIVKKTSYENLNIDPENIFFDKIGASPIELEERPYMKRKIPVSIINALLKFYQIYAERKLEVHLNIWYDCKNNMFFLDCPFQDNDSVYVTEFDFDDNDISWSNELKSKFPEKYSLLERRKNKEIIKILDTHSHHVMSLSFSQKDDSADYYEPFGYRLVGVYSSVLDYPTLHLRYFLSPYASGRPLNPYTKNEDEVIFVPSNIIDFSDNTTYEADFNEFDKHVGLKKSELIKEGV